MTRIRNVTAVLGPTNTGKTHLAIERMLGHETGMIGLPLRLLAREIYDRVAGRIGDDKVALITGEEKIKPEDARYWVCTVEAMPQDIAVDFLAIDEIQLAADPERGHVFTDRLLNARGHLETLVLGAATMREAIGDLIPGANFISRPRLSKLSYTGQKKITRLPARSAIVAFSASDVYAIAELIRRQRGGAAVVLGALSPRTRNAQVALYQSGDVDFMVATDAIGMGLNLDVDHVAFSSLRKFDGQKFRNLTPAELAQIAGRAGRHMNDGTFGVTGEADPLEQDLIDRLEEHNFDSINKLQWRERKLNFASIASLRDSLRRLPGQQRLLRAGSGDDLDALDSVARDDEIVRLAATPKQVELLWEVCQIPDYRKISLQNHAELVASVYKYLCSDAGTIDEDWFAKQVAFSDRTDGDIDTLSNRLAHIRTWTFVANRPDWLKDPAHWQGRTREIEDNLSDALHASLTERFVDARASALMKGMKDKHELNAEIGDDGSIHVESHYVGNLKGFRYLPDAEANGLEGKATRNAANHVLLKEMSMRARRVAAAKNDAFTLTRDGRLLWRGEAIARLDAGDDPLKPQTSLIADDTLQGGDRERVAQRVQTWVSDTIAERLKPLVDLAGAEDVDGLARGIAFQLSEGLGALKRENVAGDLKALDQTARGQLRRYGVRFGAFNIFFPVLLKPAAADLLLTLWCLKYGKENGIDLAEPPEAPRAGLTSTKVEPEIPEAFYRAYGFHVCGPRAVRIDMLERLADLIRPLLSWRAKAGGDTPPKGSTGDGGFTVIPEMMSILGCSPEELGQVLSVLGFRSEKRELAPASQLPAAVAEANSADGAETGQEQPTVADAEVGPGSEAAPEQDPGAAPAPPAGSADDVTGDGDGSAGAKVTPAAEPGAQTGDDAVTEPSPDPESGSVVGGAEAAVTGDQDDAEPAEPQSSSAEPPAEAAGEAGEDNAGGDDGLTVIEIWRPKRRNDGGQRRQRGRGRGARADGGQSRDGQGRQDNDRTAPGAAARRTDRPGPARYKGQDERAAGSGRNAKKGRRPRPDKAGERRRGLAVHTSAPARGKGIDPDSPFAALSALKENLDKEKSET